MMTDAALAFVPIGYNLSLVSTAGNSIPSPMTIDILGQGAGTAPANIIGNALNGVFGADTGVGGLKAPQINIVIGTAPTTSNSCTLDVAFQGAEDTGATGGYLPGTWQTFNETGPMTVANLTAGTVVRLDWPPAFPAGFNPRFLRLLFQVPTAENFTAGTISSALPVMVRDDQSNKFAAKNFVVA
jgi:hypothetical protein